MTTYNTPYKSGTVDLVSGSTLTVSGMTPAAGDVGRILVLTSGSGELQHREIVGVSGQDITLAHSFDTNPFIDESSDFRGSDVNPSASDTFVISYDVSDLIAGDVDITQDDVNHLIISGMVAQSGAYIHFKNYHVQFSASSFKSGDGGGYIFGYYNYVAGEDGYTKDSCHLVNTASGTGGEQFRVSTSSFGMLDIYGGSIYCTNTCFWRLYENAGVGNYQTRMFDVVAQGGLGGRVDGPRSFVKVTGVGGTSTLGIFNILSAPFRVELSALECNQAIYLSLLLGPEGRTVLTRLADINNTVINVASGSSNGAGLVYEVIGKKSEIDAAPAFAIVDGSGDASHTIRYGNLIKPRFITQNLSLLASDITVSLVDVFGNVVNTQTISDGIYPPAFVRHTDLPTAAGSLSLSDGTQYAPYTLSAVKYGYQFSSSTIQLEDAYQPDIIFLVDNDITEPSKAVVDAYTEANNNAELYDAQMAWLEGNLTTEAAPPITRSGNAGSFDINVDANAVEPFDFDGSTITVGSNAFNGSLTTAGTLTLLNGAIVVDATASVAGIVAGSRLRVYNVTTATEIVNQTVAGTLYSQGYISGSDYSSGDVIRVYLEWYSGASAKLGFEATVIASSAGWSVLADQEEDYVYNLNAIDGDTALKFSADYVNNRVRLVNGDNFTAAEFYAWWVANKSTEQGIRNFFGAYTAEDAANYRNNVGVKRIEWDNLSTTNARQLDAARIYASDGGYPVANDGATSGGGGIGINWQEKVLLATTGGGPLTPTQEARLLSCATEAKQDTIISDISNISGGGGGDDAATIYSYFTADSRAEAFKADVGSIPTNPLLANDARLDNIDAAISTRLAASSYVAPDNLGIAAIPTNPLLADDTRLDNLANADVATSSRLAAAGYTAPPSIAGLATTAQLNALQAHGDLNWQTATGFSSLTSADIQAELVAYGANKIAPDNAAINGLSAGLTYITKLIDNDSALLAADGVTPATPLNARFIVTYDDDGVTPLKTVNVLGVNGSPADMPNWSRYEKA